MALSSKSDWGVAAGCVIGALFIAAFIVLACVLGREVARLWKENGRPPTVAITILLLPALLLGSGCTKVSPGYAGIKIDQYGANKGVEDYPLVTGMVWYNPVSTSVIEYPCFVQTAVWTQNPNEGAPMMDESITFNTAEGLTVSGDISLSYQLQFEKVPAFYVKFRTDEISTFTHGFLRNIARDAFNEVGATYKVEDVYGSKKEELLKIVRDRINAQVNQYGVTVQQFGFIGALRIPSGVTDALNNKIKATQDAIRVENELRQSEAEAKKVVAAAQGQANAQIERARGEAEANNLLSKSITAELIEWRTLQIQQNAIDKWNGQRPMVEGNSAGLLMQLPTPALRTAANP
jgi:regulator of protease activity HflC (stomatin/prohibitin superfamily)